MDSRDLVANTAPPLVVVDTSVLVSGLLAGRGPARKVIDLWLDGRFRLLAAEQMLLECERILRHPALKEHLRLDINPADELMALLREQTLRVEVTVPTSMRAVSNPFDEMVLASAVTGKADYLVTEGDELLALEEYAGVQIVGPEQFILSLNPQPELPGF